MSLSQGTEKVCMGLRFVQQGEKKFLRVFEQGDIVTDYEVSERQLANFITDVNSQFLKQLYGS